MNLSAFCVVFAAALWFLSATVQATGMMPETSVVVVEADDGEGVINLKNTDTFPLLLLTTLQAVGEDKEKLLTVSPPTARIEPGKIQRVRFILTARTQLKTERLRRVVFEGIPPQNKNSTVMRVIVRQNLPVIIRPAGLLRDEAPWKRLMWSLKKGALSVSNPSPYVVRLNQSVSTLPDSASWLLPHTYILPGQNLTLTRQSKHNSGTANQVRISPATTWGYTVESYTAPLIP